MPPKSKIASPKKKKAIRSKLTSSAPQLTSARDLDKDHDMPTPDRKQSIPTPAAPQPLPRKPVAEEFHFTFLLPRGETPPVTHEAWIQAFHNYCKDSTMLFNSITRIFSKDNPYYVNLHAACMQIQNDKKVAPPLDHPTLVLSVVRHMYRLKAIYNQTKVLESKIQECERLSGLLVVHAAQTRSELLEQFNSDTDQLSPRKRVVIGSDVCPSRLLLEFNSTVAVDVHDVEVLSAAMKLADKVQLLCYKSLCNFLSTNPREKKIPVNMLQACFATEKDFLTFRRGATMKGMFLEESNLVLESEPK